MGTGTWAVPLEPVPALTSHRAVQSSQPSSKSRGVNGSHGPLAFGAVVMPQHIAIVVMTTCDSTVALIS